MEWSTNSYKYTDVKTGDIWEQKPENLMLICEENPRKDQECIKEVTNRFPEIWESERTITAEGSYSFVERTTRFRTKGNDISTKTSRLTALFYKGSAEDTDTAYRSVYKLMQEYLSCEEEGQEGVVSVVADQSLDLNNIRKIFEVQLRKKGCLKAEFYASAGPTAQRRRKAKFDDGIIIESNTEKGLAYADILKKIKSEVADKETLDSIKGVRKTANGNLLITTRQGKPQNSSKPYKI